MKKWCTLLSKYIPFNHRSNINMIFFDNYVITYDEFLKWKRAPVIRSKQIYYLVDKVNVMMCTKQSSN